MVLVSTTVNANQETSRPTCPSVTPSARLMSGSRPVGSISEVTERKTAAARAISPTQGKGRPAASALSVESGASREGRLMGAVNDMALWLTDGNSGSAGDAAGPVRIDCAPTCAPGADVLRRPHTSIPDGRSAHQGAGNLVR